MRNKDLIIIVFKHHFKLQTVVVAAALLFIAVLKICDIFSVPVPPECSWLRGFFHTVEKRLLSLVVGTIGFYEIYHCKLVPSVLFDIGNLEVKPLSVRLRVVVVFENQIVAVSFEFHGSPQVTAFKPRLKDQS